MKVTLHPGQTDITRYGLAQLKDALDHAMSEYRKLYDAQVDAAAAAAAAKQKVRDIQFKIEQEIAAMKEEAPSGTPWKNLT